MRWIDCFCFALVFGFILTLGACKEDVYFIPGTGTLPECTDAPRVNLDGSLWFDQGTVTILTSGCLDAQPNDTLMSCALNWAFAQNGNNVDIVVDEEYRLEGRLCGDQLHLRAGAGPLRELASAQRFLENPQQVDVAHDAEQVTGTVTRPRPTSTFMHAVARPSPFFRDRIRDRLKVVSR